MRLLRRVLLMAGISHPPDFTDDGNTMKERSDELVRACMAKGNETNLQEWSGEGTSDGMDHPGKKTTWAWRRMLNTKMTLILGHANGTNERPDGGCSSGRPG
jgi:hypothetical protein